MVYVATQKGRTSYDYRCGGREVVVSPSPPVASIIPCVCVCQGLDESGAFLVLFGEQTGRGRHMVRKWGLAETL